MGNNQSLPDDYNHSDADNNRVTTNPYSNNSNGTSVAKSKKNSDAQVHCLGKQSVQNSQQKGCEVAVLNLFNWVSCQPEVVVDEGTDRIEEEILLVSGSGQTEISYPAFGPLNEGEAEEEEAEEEGEDIEPEKAPEPKRKAYIRNAVKLFPDASVGDVDWEEVSKRKVHTTDARIKYVRTAAQEQSEGVRSIASSNSSERLSANSSSPAATTAGSAAAAGVAGNSFSRTGSHQSVLEATTGNNTGVSAVKGRPPLQPPSPAARISNYNNSNSSGVFRPPMISIPSRCGPSSVASESSAGSPTSSEDPTPLKAVKAGTPRVDSIERRRLLQMSQAASVSVFNNPYSEDRREEIEHSLWMKQQRKEEKAAARAAASWNIKKLAPSFHMQKKSASAPAASDAAAAGGESDGGSVAECSGEEKSTSDIRSQSGAFKESRGTLSVTDIELGKEIMAAVPPEVASKVDIAHLVFGQVDHAASYQELQHHRWDELERQQQQASRSGALQKLSKVISRKKELAAAVENKQPQGGELLSEDMITVDMKHCVSKDEAAALKKRVKKKPVDLIGWEVMLQHRDGKSAGTMVVTGMRRHTYTGHDYRMSRIGLDDIWVKLSLSAKPRAGYYGFRPIRKVIDTASSPVLVNGGNKKKNTPVAKAKTAAASEASATLDAGDSDADDQLPASDVDVDEATAAAGGIASHTIDDDAYAATGTAAKQRLAQLMIDSDDDDFKRSSIA